MNLQEDGEAAVEAGDPMAIARTFSVDVILDNNTAFGSGAAASGPDAVALDGGGWRTTAITSDGYVSSIAFDAAGNVTESWLGGIGVNTRSEVRSALYNGRLATIVSFDDGTVSLDGVGTLGKGSNPDISVNYADTLAAVWQQNYTATDNDIWVLTRNKAGAQLGKFKVDGGASNDTDASVAMLSNGDVAVAWNRTDPTGNTALFYAVYHTDGTPVVSATQIDARGSINRNPAIVADLTSFTITYEDNESGDLEVRAFTRNNDGTTAFSSLTSLPGPDKLSSGISLGGVDAIAFRHDDLNGDDIVGSSVYLTLIDSVTGKPLIDPKKPLHLGDGISSATSTVSLGNGKILLSYDADGDVHQRVVQIVETIKGDAKANELIGSTGGVIHTNAGGGKDHLFDSGGNDRLFGEADDDVINGGEGDDYIDGGSGNDTLDYGYVTSPVVVSLASTDPQDTGHGMDTIIGIENLEGTNKSDVLIGNDGNNILNDGDSKRHGIDTLIGGGGNDTYFVQDSGDIVVETSATGGTDTVSSKDDFVLTANVENLVLEDWDSFFGGGFKATGNSLNNTITGNKGNGTTMPTLSGLTGNDTYIVKAGGTTIVESAAASGGTNDIVKASVSYTLSTGVGVEQLMTTNAAGTSAINLKGNAFKQTITGNAGANRLTDGGTAGDVLKGLGGNDTYVVQSAATTIVESANKADGTKDKIETTVSYKLATGVGVEQLSTTDFMGEKAINLTGNAFAQTIIGNLGANRINGGAGADVLTGGGGKDTFVFSDSPKAGIDRITDMKHDVDIIQLSKADFTALGTINTALASSGFWASTAGTAHDASDRIVYETDTGKLFYDVDGNKAGAAIQFATLSTGLKLDGGDFFIVA